MKQGLMTLEALVDKGLCVGFPLDIDAAIQPEENVHLPFFSAQFD